jgi:hypothetical protein
MLRRFTAMLANVVRDNWTPDDVHFHAGTLSRPYVCEDPRCTAPHLDVRDG